jgi:YL1 nuclear protein C-terminal domain
LEGIDPTANIDQAPEEDEEYDELEEFEESTKKRKKRTTNNKRETKKSKSKVAAIPKRYLPKSLGTILLEEAYRPANDDAHNDEINAARCFIESEARILVTPENSGLTLPRRKFCPVTGTIALYTEPKSGIPYSTFPALEQIRERAPIWMMMTTAAAANNNNNSVASYYEAVKSIEER